MPEPGESSPKFTPAEFGESDAELAETLESLDDAVNYAAWIAELVQPHVGSELLEVGAGHGTFTEIFARTSNRLVATEISERCVRVLRDRFGRDDSVEIVHGTIDAVGAREPFDSAVLINVLEHIEDDEAALVHLREVLKPGGRLVLWVPAFSSLYSEYDRRIGHYRRYRKRSLEARLQRAGFTVLDIRYVNAVGAVAWLVMARWLRRTPTVGTPVKIFDRWMIPVLRAVERRISVPFGQSVFVAAARPAETSR